MSRVGVVLVVDISRDLGVFRPANSIKFNSVLVHKFLSFTTFIMNNENEFYPRSLNPETNDFDQRPESKYSTNFI